jgi:hypothetical protein
MSQMLNIRDALNLYTLLKDFIPEYDIGEDYLGFITEIICSIRESNSPEVFGESVLLMNPKTDVEKLSEMKSLDVIELFMKGLAENKFFSLRKFCEVLGYGR